MLFADRIKESTTATSTATIPLLGAAAGFRPFNTLPITVGATNIPVMVEADTGEWEQGLYTLTSASLLTRTSILTSSNGNAAVTFPAGTKRVFVDLPAAAAADFALLSTGVEAANLPDAGALSGSNYIIVVQAGVECKVSLTALQTFLGGTPVTAPGAVTSLATGSITQTTVALAWTNAAGATAWTVKQRPAGSGSYTNSTMSVAAGSAGGTVSGLTAGTAYDFQVVASNTGGDGPAATLTNVSTASVGVPAAVTSLAAGSKTDTTVTLTWANGAGATGWSVKQRLAGSGSYAASTLSVAATATGATVSGLSASTAYDFEVTSNNVSGDGPATTLLSITTDAAATAYTITAVSGTISSTLDGSSGNASTSQPAGTPTKRGFIWSKTGTAQYWGFSPIAASARCGWFPLGYTPTSADFITQSQNVGSAAVNGLAPMTSAASPNWNNDRYLWVNIGSGASTWCFWIMGVNGVPQCKNPAGMTVTGA